MNFEKGYKGRYRIKHPDNDDANEMWKLAKKSSIDTNSSYSYLMMSKFFKDRCYVIIDTEEFSKLVGFVTGFVLKDDIYFVWQICIDKKYQGEGLSKALLLEAVENLVNVENVRFIQATVSPDNDGSNALFRSVAKEYDTFFARKEGFTEDDFPDDKPEEMLIQVGPLD